MLPQLKTFWRLNFDYRMATKIGMTDYPYYQTLLTQFTSI